MSFMSGIGWSFLVIMGLFFVLIVLLRFAKYGTVLGSLASTFMGGIAIIDKSGKGDIAECVGYDQHPQTGKIRLRLNFIDKFTEGQTPFIFEEEDFDPPLSQIDWTHYAGTIICYYDFERRKDYRDNITLNLTDQVKKMKGMIMIYKRVGKDFLEMVEKQKITEAKESQNLHHAKAYKALKGLVEESNVEDIKSGDGEGMFD